MEYLIADEAATLAAGAALARVVPAGGVIYLVGDLGAGKTTFARGLLRGLGHAGAVKSPTYTLLESYEAGGRRVYHFDLYRLADPLELEYLGIRDCADAESLLLIEWPERGGGGLPAADLVLHLEHRVHGRLLRGEARTAAGVALLAAFDAALQQALA